jgi:hypothetical protein
MSFWSAVEGTVIDGAGAAVGAVPILEPVAAGIHGADGLAHEVAGAYDLATGDNEGAKEQGAAGMAQAAEGAISLIPLVGAGFDAANAGMNAGAAAAGYAHGGASDTSVPSVGNLYDGAIEKAMDWI